MSITIGIKKIICLDSYPETDFDLINEAGVEVITLEKKKIHYWAKALIDDYEAKITS
jgi:dCMP deaminase